MRYGIWLFATTGWRSRCTIEMAVTFTRTSLLAPARVMPGRTVLEGEDRVGYRASPQPQNTTCRRPWGAQGVPIPVPPETQEAQSFSSCHIRPDVDIGVELPQELTDFCVRADHPMQQRCLSLEVVHKLMRESLSWVQSMNADLQQICTTGAIRLLHAA